MTDEPSPRLDEDPLDYEAALARLDEVLQALEDGKVALEDAIALYERGVRLVHRCSALLAGAERRISELSQGPDGELVEGPFQLPLEEGPAAGA